MNTEIIKLNQELDEKLSWLGVIVSIFLLLLAIHFNLSIVLILTSVLTLISCIIWLRIQKNVSLKLNIVYSYKINILCLLMFTILFTASILSIYFSDNLYERPLTYFILTALMVGILSIEIIYFPNKLHPLILGQIILVGISIAWSQLLIFPDLLGNDPNFHRMFAQKIVDTHFIPDGFFYSKLPLFHLYIDLTSLIMGINYKFATMLSVSLSQIICNVLFIFILSKAVFNSNSIGSLAALLTIVSNQHIFMTYWSIPNAFAAIFMLILFWILLIFKSKGNSIIAASFTFLYGTCLILTHTISSMCMAIQLISFYLGILFYNYYFNNHSKAPYSSNYVILYLVSMFSWWTFASGHIYSLARLIKWGFSIDNLVSTPLEIRSEIIQSIPLFENVFNSIGMLLFFSISFIGCFYMISKKYGNLLTFGLSIVGVIPLALSFLSSVTQHSIIEQRWWYFAQIFLSIPLSVSFFALSNIFRNKSRKILFMGGSTVFLSFILIMSPIANIDNPIFSPHTSMRTTLTVSELQAVKTTSYMWSGNIIKTDNYYARAESFIYNTEPCDNELYNGNFYKLKNNLVLIRKEIIENPFQLFASIYSLKYNPLHKLEVDRYTKIYDCGSVYGFL